MAKTVRIYDRAFTVSGGEGDDYYRHIPDGTDITDPVLRALRPHVARDSVCIDAGANIGLYSLALSSLAPEGRVYAFEPSPSAFSHLGDNLRVNRVGNVETSALALSDRPGTVQFHDFSFFSAGSFSSDEGSLLGSDSYGSTSIQAPTITLDSFVAERGLTRIDFMKIDVEGGELSVLNGATEVLARHRPVVVLEFNSFGFTIHQSVLPQVALARIKELFPCVFVIDRIDGELARLGTPHEEYEFLYDNGIHGPTDNLLCAFDDLPVTRRYAHVWTARPQLASPVAGQASAGAAAVEPTTPPPAALPPLPDRSRHQDEAEAMRRTLSWRITAPLRRLRTRLDATPAAAWLRHLPGGRP